MKLSRILLVVTLTMSVLVFTAPVPVAAQELLDGCDFLNDPFFDGHTSHMLSTDAYLYFLAGDVLTIDAQPPDTPTTSTTFSFSLGGTVLGTQSYPGTLVITFATDRTGTGFEFLMTPETFVTFTVSCAPASGARIPPEIPDDSSIPGCDLAMQLPSDAVVGTFVADTTILWGPDTTETTTLTMPAGKTAWVIGMDASGKFYKFVWSCSYVWAPVSALGPNYDAVWNGTPLPTTVVK